MGDPVYEQTLQKSSFFEKMCGAIHDQKTSPTELCTFFREKPRKKRNHENRIHAADFDLPIIVNFWLK